MARIMSKADCIFCTRRNQPPVLFETKSFYVMPDKFPFLPGHTLIISKEHRSCFGDTSTEVLGELDEAAARVRTFSGRHTAARPG